MLRIGPYCIEHPVMLAPMAGVTDRPYRQLCRAHGAAYSVSEMLSCDLSLLRTAKTKYRMNHTGEQRPVVAQIAGSDPEEMAAAAQHNVRNGAQIIDINMGCPAKKVARKSCGSALLEFPERVRDIIKATCEAVDVPVTLKTRLGLDHQRINIHEIADIAQRCGISALFVHARNKQQKFTGRADFSEFRALKNHLDIPLIANGDIDGPEKAAQVIELTGCDAIMVGRAALGNPWIFQQIRKYLQTGEHLPTPDHDEVVQTMYNHVLNMHDFYGEQRGVRMARKHIKWFLQRIGQLEWARTINRIEQADHQLHEIRRCALNKVA